MIYLHDECCAGLLEGLEGVDVACTACVVALLGLVMSRRLIGVLSRQCAWANSNSAAIDKSHKAAQPLSTPRKKSENAVPRFSPFMKTQLPLTELGASVQPAVFASWFAPQ